jgi:hypothetical protein
MKVKADPVDSVVRLLFLLRVGMLGLLGVFLAWQGYSQTRHSFLILGSGLLLCSVASFFWRHPTRPSRLWFMVFGVLGLILSAIGLSINAA